MSKYDTLFFLQGLGIPVTSAETLRPGTTHTTGTVTFQSPAGHMLHNIFPWQFVLALAFKARCGRTQVTLNSEGKEYSS